MKSSGPIAEFAIHSSRAAGGTRNRSDPPIPNFLQTSKRLIHVLRFGFLQSHDIGIGVAADHTQLAAIERSVKVSICSDLKLVICLPGDPSRGWSKRFSAS
jgi:hypothetical protein